MRLHNRLQTGASSSQAGGREYHSTRSVDNNSKKSVASFTTKGWPMILTIGLRIWGILAHNGRPAKLNQRIIFICWQLVDRLAKARSSSGFSPLDCQALSLAPRRRWLHLASSCLALLRMSHRQPKPAILHKILGHHPACCRL
jgi:hypothetical protein